MGMEWVKFIPILRYKLNYVRHFMDLVASRIDCVSKSLFLGSGEKLGQS
jgi:hypothetical protein